MAEAVVLDLVDAETVALSLEDGEQVSLSFTEEVVQFEVLGEVGAQGPRGWAGTMAVGDVTTGAPGTDAAIVNVGTVHDAVLDFDIPRGDVGPQGIQGDEGTAATIAVGETSTGTPGSDAEVTNTGTSLAAVFDFTIPEGLKGDTGDAATIEVGEVTTGTPGTDAAVTNTGDEHAAIFDFDIPRGEVGPQGIQGVQGIQGEAATIEVGDVEASAPGDDPTVVNSGDEHETVFDFTLPRGETGPQGPPGLDTGYYRHTQAAPISVWSVEHNLGFYPSVFVQDSAGSVVYGDVNYVDQNNLTITFGTAFGGFANLS